MGNAKSERAEKSLLLYLETRAVDYSGKVDVRMMNAEDMAIAERWSEEGFIIFRRRPASEILNSHANDGTHLCRLSEAAWEAAHKERRARADRNMHSALKEDAS